MLRDWKERTQQGLIIRQKIKNFLLSQRSREFLIFLFFFFIAAAFWLVQTLDRTYEMDIPIRWQMEAVPNGIVLTSEPEEYIKVRVKDKGTALLNYKLSRGFFPIVLNFSDYANKKELFRVPTAHLNRQVSTQLFASSKIVSIKPDTLLFIYASAESKKVPVRLEGKVSAALKYYITDTIIQPDSVLVYAPSRLLDTLKSIDTEVVNFSDLSEKKSYTASLAKQKGMKLVPDAVDLNFLVDMYTEKTIEIPVIGVNFPPDKAFRAFPSKIKVTFQVGAKDFSEVKENDFKVLVSYDELLKLGSNKYRVSLKALPNRKIYNVRISPEEVDFLIEQFTTDGN